MIKKQMSRPREKKKDRNMTGKRKEKKENENNKGIEGVRTNDFLHVGQAQATSIAVRYDY